MSNYTITTDFGAKDSLPSSNSAKVVRGSEFTTEFTNIQTAIATKADTAGDTFTGVVNFSADVAVNSNTLFVDVSEAKVGIGTTSPASKLHIHQDSTDYSILKLSNSDTGFGATDGLSIWSTGNQAAVWNYEASPLLFGTSGTTRMSIDSSGNVGIGTTNPSAKLHVEINDNTAYSSANMLNGTIAQYIFNTSDTDGTHAVLGFGVDGTSTDAQAAIGTTYTDAGDGALVMGTRAGGNVTERMRIDSSGKLLLNTSTHTLTDSEMVVASEYSASGTTTGGITLSSRQSGSWRNSGIFANGNDLTFTTGDTGLNGAQASSERMRIDSSGRLLVGTTDTSVYDSASGGNTGFVYSPNHLFQLARETTTTTQSVMNLNKMGSDGNIIELYKDGSTVGSIGTKDGDIYLGTGDTGLRFYDDGDAIYPAQASDSAGRDNAVDLGSTSKRFKNIYLSGSVLANTSLNVDNPNGYAAVELGGPSGAYIDLKNPATDDYDARIITDGTDLELITANGDIELSPSGSVLVGTTGATANAKLKVNGAAILNDSVIYTKNYSALDTTGHVVAKATGGNNGSSTTFIFTGQGGGGAPFHIVFACINAGGQWSATRSEIAASSSVDVVASTSGNDVLFTFKSKSGTQSYSPKVKIETVGSNYDTTYLAA